MYRWTPVCLSTHQLGDIWVAQMVKHLSTRQETQVPSLGREDPLEKEMAAHFSTIAWKTPWMEEPGRLQSMGLQRVRHDWEALHTHTHTHTHVPIPDSFDYCCFFNVLKSVNVVLPTFLFFKVILCILAPLHFNSLFRFW